MDWPEGARAVLHVDMDAFYASVEELDDPTLLGRPVIVGGPKDARGVVSAASYAAREFGVHSAMPLRVAGRLCPNGVFLPVRMKRYIEMSRRVFRIFERVSPSVEPLSVDEAFLDLTGCERLLGGPIRAARDLRRTIFEELGLTASIGVAPNKFVAKIASDLRKPDALVVVHPDKVQETLAPLEVERMWGVGPRGAEALRKIGVRTFGDLDAAGPARLKLAVGNAAVALAALARGEDARPLVLERAPKSVGHETTYAEDESEEECVHATLLLLSDRVGARLRKHGLQARCVTLKIRYAPFQTLTRRVTLETPVCTTTAIFGAAWRLFCERTSRARKPVRLVGVSTSGFSPQRLLFSAPGRASALAVEEAVDQVRARYGTGALERGTVLGSSRAGSRDAHD